MDISNKKSANGPVDTHTTKEVGRIDCKKG
jgi:hypothetical protein